VTQLVAATVPNVDRTGKGSKRERGDRESGREQVKRSSVRNRPVEGRDKQMAEKGRMATEVVREREREKEEGERKRNEVPIAKRGRKKKRYVEPE